ncbi:MAG: alpha/beta hydrolase [Ruminiclostridium sp.]|nr:alpha/beta hydrolase [Ruminiclostridium sp.]
MINQYIEDSQHIYENWKKQKISDFETKIFDRGKGPVLFQTPIASHLEPFWVPIILHFEKKRRMITYQRRESTSFPFNAWDRAKDLKMVMDHLEIEQCDFVSHSSGALATLHFALMYPERVRSMVLMNVAAYYPNLQGLVAFMSDNFAQLLPNSVVSYLFLMYLAKRGTPEYDLHKYAFGQFNPLKKYMKHSLNHIIKTHDIRSNLHEIRCPVLLINRTDDKVVSMEAMEYLNARLPDCYGLKAVTGGGHMFHYTHARPIIQFIEDFYTKMQ